MKTVQELIDAPLALWPGYSSALISMIQATQGPSPTGMVSEAVYGNDRPYEMIDGVAVIPINGVLVQDYCWGWNETTYSSIDRKLVTALTDDDVKAIAYHVCSPGGEVSNCFDLADRIFELRGIKPMWAILDEYAYSAAYALASAADRIIVPRTGGTGSIGVITMRLDITAMLEKFGVKVHTINFGERKTDSYPTVPLSDDARDRIKADINTLGGMFVSLVARNRNLSEKAVRETEAGTFLGDNGVKAGLADDVMAPDEAFLSLVAEISQT